MKSKKNLIIKSLLVLVLVAMVAIGIGDICSMAYNGSRRNYAMGDIREGYTCVYADMVSIEPEGFIYSAQKTKTQEITKVVCKCTTVEGTTVWALFNAWDYPEGDSQNVESYKTWQVSDSSSMRVIGCIKDANEVLEGDYNGDGLILVVYSVKAE